MHLIIIDLSYSLTATSELQHYCQLVECTFICYRLTSLRVVCQTLKPPICQTKVTLVTLQLHCLSLHQHVTLCFSLVSWHCWEQCSVEVSAHFCHFLWNFHQKMFICFNKSCLLFSWASLLFLALLKRNSPVIESCFSVGLILEPQKRRIVTSSMLTPRQTNRQRELVPPSARKSFISVACLVFPFLLWPTLLTCSCRASVTGTLHRSTYAHFLFPSCWIATLRLQ